MTQQEFVKKCNELPQVMKDVIHHAFKAQDAKDSTGNWTPSVKTIARLTGIPYETLYRAFNETDHNVNYNLRWLINVGYSFPDFIVERQNLIN